MKILIIILAVIFSLSACFNLDFKLPDIDFGCLNGGSVVFPPSDDPDVPSEPSEDQPVVFDLKNWHVNEHEERCKISVECSECHAVYDHNLELTLDMSDTFAWGRNDTYQCTCGAASLNFYQVHCFVNGFCHSCDVSCDHLVGPNDVYYWSDLPDGHPLKAYNTSNYEDWPYSQSYVVDGVCQLCGMNV